MVLSSKEKWYPAFFWIARNIWANVVMYGAGFFPKITYDEKIVKGKSYMLIANHTSMLDIMLMLKVSRNPFVFVGKKELTKLPVFGFFYKRVCILVDRSNANSRSAAYKKAKERLNQGLSICIFPEGGVPDDISIVLDNFKDGAFRLSIEYQVPLVPMVFNNKKRFPYVFLKGTPGVSRAKVLPFISTEGLDKTDKNQLKKQAYHTMLSHLEA
ncbi:1-acyl-sn-glycerol-3-phosphate acyltransferase [Neptunitalea chrysea]|uniref:1-acyl-sn-glycerol-3-phosphate acyltransferase n=1 Tax=Neptunitalea chrysea TaxID=1647581 RepID=A0A9W6EVF4_9FLAO|nr:1-acyl-sn-glycerol-3-phosphate acyltransferase [Neptunitalea chrysea]